MSYINPNICVKFVKKVKELNNMYNLLSIFIGGLIAIMISFNSILGKHTGTYTSTVIIHVVGLIAVIIVLIIKKYKVKFVKGLPLLLYTGGAIGIITVVCNTISMNAIGATITISIGLLGQVLSSILIDHYGLLGVSKVNFNNKKAIGLSVMILGIIIMTLY